jgi:ribosomal protein S18 acetylase RimI-like enzyme
MNSARTRPFLREITQSFADVRRHHGTIAAVCSMADRFASKCINLCVSHLFCLDLERPGLAQAGTSEFAYRFLTPHDIRLFAMDSSNELTTDLADRVAEGHDVCFGVLAGQRLAGYGWCAIGSIEPEHTGGLGLLLPPDMGYLYKGFTHADFRGRGLNGIRLALASHALAQRGIRKLVCLVDWTNWASIRSCRRAGCQQLGRVVTCRIAGRRYWFVPDAAQQLGIRFVDEVEVLATRRIAAVAAA